MRRGSKALLGAVAAGDGSSSKMTGRVVTVVLTAKDGRVWIKDEAGDSFICRRWQLSPVL